MMAFVEHQLSCVISRNAITRVMQLCPRTLTLVFGLLLMVAPGAHSAIKVREGLPGNLFLTNETVQIPLDCDGGEIRWIVTDYFGNTVNLGRMTPQNGRVLVKPDLSAPGYFQLHVTELDDERLISTLKTSFAIMTPLDTTAMADSPFGVMTHFAQHNDPAVLALLARAGIVHFRDEQYWNAIETQPGVFTYPSKFTAYMTKARTLTQRPLIALNWSNRFYDYDNGDFTAPYTEAGRQGFANYAINVLNRYIDQIPAVEVWNEYNAGTFIKGPATANKPYYYALMLKKVYETIKPLYPSVKVLAGATVPIAHGFFKQLFERGALSYLDAVSIHAYRDYPDGVELEIAELRELIKRYNNGQEKPIWATEFNLVGSNGFDRFERASRLAQLITLMLSQKVERMYYYLAMDDTSFPLWGLVGAASDASGKFRPHPALIAYAVLIRQLYGAGYESRFNTLASTYAFRFRRGVHQISVLWSNFPVTVSLAAPSELVITDIMGGVRTMAPVSGQVFLNLNKDVQYVLGSTTSVTEVTSNLVADSVSGYSKTAGQNGWYYGYADLGSSEIYDPSQFEAMTWGIWGADSYRWLAPAGYPFASGSSMHPSKSWAIRRWVSNIAGPVSLSGVVSRGGGGDGVNIRIFVDGSEVFSKHLSPNQSINYTVPDVFLKVGSKIDFTVNRAGESSFDATSFTSTIVRQSSAPAVYNLDP